jgi:gliding motility-associated-like protein
MKYAILSTLCLAVSMSSWAALDFSGNTAKVISISPEASTGLSEIYVIDSTSGVKASYTASSASATVKWSRFSNLGGGYAEEISGVSKEGSTYSITLGSDDSGYIIEENGRQYCYWIVNYANHEFVLNALNISAESDCSRAVMQPIGKGDKITYYTINGRGVELSRELELIYHTLQYDSQTESYRQVEKTETFGSLSSTIAVDAPLCDTYFVLWGDRFQKEWGREYEEISPNYQAVAVDAQTDATQDESVAENEIAESTSGLGGSGPCDITFKAVVSDAAIYHEWQISRDSEFDILENTYSDLEFNYTFRDNGTTYVRFIANNAAGTCEYIGTTYEVFIGESKLLCPNAFSPNSSPGINDEWRVSYKSIIKFECHIFNRWGKEMFSFTNPAEGWDGKYNGKAVPAGVYYYVIKAEGSDGVKYKLSGDINIINYHSTSGTSDSSESVVAE